MAGYGILGGGQPYIPGLSDFRVAEGDAQRRNALAQQHQIGILKMQQLAEQQQAAQERKGLLNTAAAGLPEAERPMFQLDPSGYMTRKDNQQFRSQEAEAARTARRQELEMRLQDSRLNAQDRANLQRELQQMQLQGRADLLKLGAQLRPPRQEPAPQIVQTDAGPMQVGRDGRAVPIVGPDGQPVKPKASEKALPTSAAQKLMENQSNLRKADQAVAMLEGGEIRDAQGNVTMTGDTEATGKKGFLTNLGLVGDYALNAIDPKGVDTRAAVGDLGSMIIHDRSGAAVTAAEFPRLRPFIPLATDSPPVAKQKARRFAQEFRAVTEEAAEFYRGSGYKVPTEALRGAGNVTDGMPKVTDEASYNAIPDGARYIDPQGRTRTKGKR